MEEHQNNNPIIPELQSESHQDRASDVLPLLTQSQNRLSPRVAGIISLLLIFFAGASFTWVFLEGGATKPPVAVAAAVQATAAPTTTAQHSAFDGIDLLAKGAIVEDLTSGKTLYEQNADTPLPLASLTKVPLTLVVVENLPAGTVITIPYDTSPYDTSQKLRQGERWNLQDVIDFTLAVSSNEGADILAQSAAASIQQRFLGAPADNPAVWRMNQLVQSLGLSHTYFLNDNGLDESETQAGAYGSARDMATLFAYAANNDAGIFAATTKAHFTLHSIDGAETTAVNTDEALPVIPGIIMGKTGYTDLAGGNLAVVFEVGGHRVSAVVLGSTQSGRFDDMKKLVAVTTSVLKPTE